MKFKVGDIVYFDPCGLNKNDPYFYKIEDNKKYLVFRCIYPKNSYHTFSLDYELDKIRLTQIKKVKKVEIIKRILKNEITL